MLVVSELRFKFMLLAIKLSLMLHRFYELSRTVPVQNIDVQIRYKIKETAIQTQYLLNYEYIHKTTVNVTVHFYTENDVINAM